MPVPDRAQWVKWRDAAKVPKGFGKHDMGPEFEKFAKITGPGGGDWKERYAAAVKLRKVCLDYYADLSKSKDKTIKAFANVFDTKIYKDLVKLESDYKAMAQPAIKLKAQLTALVQGMAGVTDAKSWAAFWSGPVRGVGTILPLMKNSLPAPDFAKLQTAWPPHLATGKYQAKGSQSDNDRKACMKEVTQQAAAVNQLAHALAWW